MKKGITLSKEENLIANMLLKLKANYSIVKKVCIARKDANLVSYKLVLKNSKEDIFKDIMKECVNYCEPLLEIRPEIVLYGKVCHQNRDVAFFSDDTDGFKFSNRKMMAIPLNLHLKVLLSFINDLVGQKYNGIAVNRYNSGLDYISPHSDKIKNKKGVAAVSFGARRVLRVREKETKDLVLDKTLQCDEIVVMEGNFQQEFTHEVPVDKRCKSKRVSFTMRYHE